MKVYTNELGRSDRDRTRALRNSNLVLSHINNRFSDLSNKKSMWQSFVDPNCNFCVIILEIINDLQGSIKSL